MPHPCPHHCPSGRGGAAAAVLVVIAAAAAVKVVLAILTALLIALAVIAGLALAGGAVYVAAAVRSGRLGGRELYGREQMPLGAPQRAALPASERHLHIHLHGADPAEVAALLAAQSDRADPEGGPAGGLKSVR